jgi:hypothetical protein
MPSARYIWISLLLLSSTGEGQELPDAPRPAITVLDRFSFASTSPAISIESIELEPSRDSQQHFRWQRALWESFEFLAISHSYLAYRDYHYMTVEGVPFNHYWRDYKISLSTWAHSGWSDGDPFLDNYIGHPIQGAITGYIQVQNDPQGEKLEFSNSKAYWKSRFKAMLWNAAYSTQFEIGPLGEMTVEKYGNLGSWTQNGKRVTGEGQVDLVVTPIGGMGWMVMEDLLDKHIARRVEGSTRNSFWINFTRCAINPIRGGANILHHKWPWYRASRKAAEVYYSHQMKKGPTPNYSGASD